MLGVFTVHPCLTANYYIDTTIYFPDTAYMDAMIIDPLIIRH